MRLAKNNIKERIKGSFIELLDISFIENDSETLEATMFVKPEFSQSTKRLHGGVTIALAETIAGVGSNSICAEDEFTVGLQVSANHISGAQLGDTVRAIGTLLHKGRTTHVWNVDVILEGTEKLVSSVRVINLVLKIN